MRQVLKLLTLILLISASCKTANNTKQTKQAMTTVTENMTKQTLAAVENFIQQSTATILMLL